MSKSFQEYVKTDVKKELKAKLGLKNDMMVPRVEKVVINVGIGKGLQDKSYNEHVAETLQRISGQKPVFTKARKSIATFKIRAGMNIGIKVTLRGKRMYDFIERLVKVSLPRVRDFRGLSVKSFDQQGNFTIGVREHLIFPEINADEVEKIHGLEVVISTNSRDRYESFWLLKLMGFPFRDELTK